MNTVVMGAVPALCGNAPFDPPPPMPRSKGLLCIDVRSLPVPLHPHAHALPAGLPPPLLSGLSTRVNLPKICRRFHQRGPSAGRTCLAPPIVCPRVYLPHLPPFLYAPVDPPPLPRAV